MMLVPINIGSRCGVILMNFFIRNTPWMRGVALNGEAIT